MNLTITARHFKAKDSLKEMIHEKMEKLNNYHDKILDCEVILSEENDSKIAEVKVHLNHKLIVLTEKSENMYKSIELISDRLTRQLIKQKGKRKSFNHRKIMENISIPAPVTEDEFDY
jgi:putative sigma-54 modulation protein